MHQSRVAATEWRRHFMKIWNIQSQFDDSELDKVRQRPRRYLVWLIHDHRKNWRIQLNIERKGWWKFWYTSGDGEGSLL